MNNQIFFFLYSFANQSDFLDKIIVFFAVYFPYIVIIIAGIFILMHHEVLKAEEPFRVMMEKKRELLMAFFSGIVAWVIAYIFKFIFSFPRPFDALAGVQSLFPETGHAFPSGHATFFMALAVAIFFLHKKAGYFFIFCALLIGIARVMAGVHFPIDILGGFLTGFFVSYILSFFVKRF